MPIFKQKNSTLKVNENPEFSALCEVRMNGSFYNFIERNDDEKEILKLKY